MSKDKNLMEFYKRHLFLLNENCNKNFRSNILPLLRSEKYFSKLFENESLIIKKFIYRVEEEIKDVQIISLVEINNFCTKIRKNILSFMAKTMNYYLTRNKIRELYFDYSKIGFEGSIIISSIIKSNQYLEYVDLSNSSFTEEDLNRILTAVYNLNEYFISINLSGISYSSNILKFIKLIKNKDGKLSIITENNILSKSSKASSDNNKRVGKYKKYTNI